MKKGFTLIEVMLVLVIIGMIAVVAIPTFKNMSVRNNTAKAKADLAALQIAVENYYLYHNGAYPSQLSDLETAVPRITRTIPKDPHSSAQAVYGYNTSSNKKYYVIYSVGPSGGGSAYVNDSGDLVESDGPNCIYVSNIQGDTTP